MVTPVDTAEVRTALAQLAEIHAQVLRSEVFSGYRTRPMICTALLALTAALLQATVFPSHDAGAYARLWIVTAGLCTTLCVTDLFVHTWRDRASAERRRVLKVSSQFAPAFVAGSILPLVLVRPELGAVGLLPGLWALVFGLGVFASRPFLPRAIGYVGLWYCGSGVVQLLQAGAAVPGPWGMGITFCVGQALTACILHFGIERKTAGEA